MMKKLFVGFILSFLFVSVTFAQENDKYKESLQKMMILSGSEESYKMAITQMMTMFKQQKPDVPANIWDELEAEFLKTSLTDLVDMLTPVYKKHLTLEDVKGMISFYETPLGKKFALKTPLIMQESMQVGQQWGMKIGQEFAKKMAEKGY